MKPCHRHVTGSTPLHVICTYCGHLESLHPGWPNPNLDHCLACLILVIAEPSRRRWKSNAPEGVNWVQPS